MDLLGLAVDGACVAVLAIVCCVEAALLYLRRREAAAAAAPATDRDVPPYLSI